VPPQCHWLGCCLGIAILVAGCSREDPSVKPRPVDAAPPTQIVEQQPHLSAIESPSPLPRQGGVTGYAGSDSCQSCHQDQHASWHRSYHRTMTQLPTPEAVQANFNGVILTNDGTRFVLKQEGQRFQVRLERADPMPPGQPIPEPVETELGLVTGSHHMQVFWIPSGQGNAQVGFPFTWLIPEKRWVPRNSTFIRPPDFVHRPEMWNVICSRCHSTGPEPRMDSVARRLDTRVAELGISCEACHGPGERHVIARTAAPKDSPLSAEILAKEIVQPAKLDAKRSAQVCGFCHSMKWIPNTERWVDHGFSFRPGDDLEATTPVIRPTATNRPPTLTDFLNRNPDILNDFFWSDGMMRVSGREYNGLLESACNNGGKLSCISCHSLHDSDPDDQLARNRTDHRACTQCHERYREESFVLKHTHHQVGSSGNDCYNCHMPHTTYGVLKAIRSHQITSPKVASDLATGRPNACNLCHLDRSLDWTASKLNEWFGQTPPTLTADQKMIPESVRLAWAGDAGQRVLIAWHFGWKPALETSGTHWIPAALAPLLTDEYAAVRCVAGRSLQAWPEFYPTNYDFAQPGRVPEAAMTQTLVRWRSKTTQTAASPSLFNPQDTSVYETTWIRLKSARDNRLMRLRE
jgi:hypothetical protein